MTDSIYTLSLRHRGISAEAAQDMSVLRKYTIDHLPLEPIVALLVSDPIQRAIDLAGDTDRSNFIVTDAKGVYRGVITTDELQQVLIDKAAIPLLTVGEVMRSDVRPVRHTENLASLFDAFVKFEVDAMPIGLEYDPSKTIGLVTRDALLRHTQKHWLGK
jgi:signal-transduction protein with cAMP-binding, CBS, and nucleotidyltransferase domain